MLVQVRDNKKTLIGISNYDKYQVQFGIKSDENGTTICTSDRTSINSTESFENSKEEQSIKIDLDMSRSK